MTTSAADNIATTVTVTETVAPQRTATSPRGKWTTALVCVGLLTLVLVCYFRTLKDGYFLADDFGEFGYIEKIVHGRWDLFVANWTGNYMQIPSMAVYRPWQLMSLLACYLIGKANPFPWYAANVLFYFVNSVLLYAVCRRLTSGWAAWRSTVAAVLASALFIVNPLHCESVSWVVGRVDIECCSYFLLATWAFLRYFDERKRWQLFLSLGCFWLGMLVKEMAIGFPVMATAIAFLAPHRIEDQTTLKARALRAAQLCWPVWASTVVYFVVRYLALHTLTGGYIGTIGNGQAAYALQRWLDPDNYRRVFLPFAASLFRGDNVWAFTLSACYASLVSVLAVKLLRKEIPWRLVAFCAVWIVSAAVPIYKLWGIGLDLEGARFCYFLTVAGSAAIAMIALAPPKQDVGLDAKATALIASALLAVAAVCLYKGCQRTNAAWVHASKEVRAILKTSYELAKSTDAATELLVLGIPKKNAGAHMIYNGVTFRLGLQQPVCAENVSERFINFDPIFYGHDEYINSARFKRCLASPNARGPFVWDSQKLAYRDANLIGTVTGGAPIKLSANEQSASVQAFADGHATVNSDKGIYTFANNQVGDGLQFNNLKIDPRQYDYLQFEYKLPAQTPKAPLSFQAKWTGTASESSRADNPLASLASDPAAGRGEFAQLRIPVSHHWRWFSNGTIKSLALILPPVSGIQVRNVTLLSADALRPTLSITDVKPDVSGVHVTGDTTTFAIDAGKIPGAAKLQIQSTKGDYFFDQIDGNVEEGVYKNSLIDGATFRGSLPSGAVPPKCYSEVRARALDAVGKPLGEWSEPVTIYAANQKYIPSLW